MRSAVIAVVILSFLWGMLGYFVCFELEYQEIKSQFKKILKENVNNDELIKFDLSLSEFDELVWRKKNEFSFQGNFYDVVRKKETTKGVILFCVSDAQEKVLFEHLEEMIGNKLKESKNDSSVESTFFTLDLSINEEHLVIPWLKDEKEISDFQYLIIPIKGYTSSTFSPPDFTV